jgi:hypothetical protein
VTKAVLADTAQRLRVPPKVRVPIRKGVYDAGSQVWRTDSLEPTNLLYSASFYDNTHRLIASDSNNALVNPGFEQGGTGWTAGAPPFNVGFGSPEGASHSGILAMLRGADGINLGASLAATPFIVKPGEVWHFEGYVQSSGANGFVTLASVQFSASNVSLGVFGNESITTAATWRKVSWYGQMSAGAATCQVSFGVAEHSTGTWIFDDFSAIRKKFPITSPIYTLNPPTLTVPSVVLA